MDHLTAQLVQAIERSGQSRYQIAKGTGLHQSVLSRLVHGETTLSATNAERLAEYLGYEIVLRPKGERRKAK